MRVQTHYQSRLMVVYLVILLSFDRHFFRPYNGALVTHI
jgi:hypothetical protein